MADLLIGNNVLAHVPDVNDFVEGARELLKKDGVVTMEFPHLLQLVANNQFDTIYHEHFSYFSLHTATLLFRAHGLRIFDVERLSTHGGSLRIHACHHGNPRFPPADRVAALLDEERDRGMQDIGWYRGFQARVDSVKNDFVAFLIEQARAGRRVVAYGAAAKGNTLLNYCGVRPDLLPLVADISPHKQGKFLPGSHIPVVSPAALLGGRPDFVVILPWNLRDEVSQQLGVIRGWGGRFVTAIPSLTVW
jgi:hypothetical protein